MDSRLVSAIVGIAGGALFVALPDCALADPEPSSQASTAAAPARMAGTRFSGTLFVDFTHVGQTSNGVETDGPDGGFDVKRLYLGIDHAFGETWSANLTTDVNYHGNDGDTQFFVKKAYLQGRFSPMAVLRIGSAGLPWISLVDDWYGYRFIEKSLTDRTGFGASTDWGVHLFGDNGVFNYAASVINGRGYRNPSLSGSVDFEGRVGVQPVKGLVLALGGYRGDRGGNAGSAQAWHGAHRIDATVAFNTHGLRMGAEWFEAGNWNNVNTPNTDSADGWSLWGSYDFPKASFFARHDRVRPSRDIDPSLTDSYHNLGVAFPVGKGVRMALAWKSERLRNDGSIDVRTREIGVWGEAKW